jgi:hypothetical protein
MQLPAFCLWSAQKARHEQDKKSPGRITQSAPGHFQSYQQPEGPLLESCDRNREARYLWVLCHILETVSQVPVSGL